MQLDAFLEEVERAFGGDPQERDPIDPRFAELARDVAGYTSANELAVLNAAARVMPSDECYLGLVWEGEAPSVLDPRVCDGDHTGLLALHSLSKTSNLAGYRAGFVAGDPDLVGELLTYRKHAGLMVPLPVQSAMVAALDDDGHEDEQRVRYRARRAKLKPAVEAAGLRVDHSEAGLYLWATADEPCRQTVDRLAERGLLVAPGEFYGPAGARHVRIALTATDEAIDEAVRRLAG